ncbi:hypothetical protein CDAR_224271 [Caerostris darwini]|uniref:Uncharacterized protein n=1 Tax=Caerostris darwini TaxID=1538125 RepID=A0AAV4Q904_9ARAC|nr:hypothetical protein CDAR_224271 [Caerostris darwini]
MLLEKSRRGVVGGPLVRALAHLSVQGRDPLWRKRRWNWRRELKKMVMWVCKHCGNNAASVLRVVTYGIHREPVWAPRIHTRGMSKSRSPLVKLKLTEQSSEKKRTGHP